MTPWLQDADVTLYHGDVLAVLRELPAESVDCCVTSPPFWGLRDYGTATWDGGNAECDHVAPLGGGTKASGLKHPDNALTQETIDAKVERIRGQYRVTCGKCGATRTDQQIGLEPTPEEYVTRMVEVFREVRRVLASHGTVWLNLGDSYASSTANGGQSDFSTSGLKRDGRDEAGRVRTLTQNAKELRREQPTQKLVTGLKPKDLVGIPWRVAFALQADGWYLRSDIIWAKPNPMPESVTDRPTKAHEYVFLLSKQPRYFFDQEAVREAHSPNTHGGNRNGIATPSHTAAGRTNAASLAAKELHPAGRNIRSVWEIATQPYPDAHFATFPEELARRCIAAGCPEQVCRVCGKARERIASVEQEVLSGSKGRATQKVNDHNWDGVQARTRKHVTTLGWSFCEHHDGSMLNYRPGVTLDPFMGSGTVAHVARKLGRHAVGIDLNESYLELAARRLQQQSLFAEVSAQ